VIYILLDTRVGNYVGTFRSAAEALADVRDTVAQFGRGYVADWALVEKSEAGVVTAIAEGDELIRRALTAGANV